MRKKKWLLLSLLSLLLLATNVLTICAEESDYFSEDYTYTVRIYAGNQGTFADGSTEIIIKATPGTTIDLRRVLDGVTMNKSKDALGNEIENKYYAKGIRESGKDNNTVNVSTGPVFKITKDCDYVVAYAMAGGNVAYTVNYVDKTTGTELLPSQTFYGNVGEKAVVAYQYIDGFVPQAYNIGKVLVEDETKNVITFEYKPAKASGYYYYETDGGIKYVDREGETTVEYIPGTVIHVQGGGSSVMVIPGGNRLPGAQANTAQGENQNPGNGGNPADAQNPDGGENTGNEQDSNNDQNQGDVSEQGNDEPEEYIEITDEPVPLEDTTGGGETNSDDVAGNQMTDSMFLFLVIVGVAIVAVVVTSSVFVHKRKAQKNGKSKEIDK